MVDASVAPNKLAMSRALGAAFLNHKVTQLERSVNDNWRDRRTPDSWRTGDGKRTFPAHNILQKRSDGGSDDSYNHPDGYKADHERRRSEDAKTPKVADVIVLDASVLIHGLYHVKKWSREGREEIVIVPLEALNTLDLLKKGTSVLAQRARAASRILEAQVGTNPRIRVQRDDAFVLWDDIPFDEQKTALLSACPEWVRRTICCARWELEHAADESSDNEAPASREDEGLQHFDNNAPKPRTTPDKLHTKAAEGTHDDKKKLLQKQKPRVVLAVVAPSADTQPESAANPVSPVPLPAPQPNKYESRLSGALIARWGAAVGVEVLEVTPAPPPSSSFPPGTQDGPVKGRRSGEEERTKRAPAGRGRRNSRGSAPAGGRPPMGPGHSGLVERPQAVMTMMEMVTQPNRVVRVLARGEKLDP